MPLRKRISAAFTPGADPGAAIARLLEETARFAALAKLAPREREKLAVIVEEVASNAARHGMGSSDIRIGVELNASDGEIGIVIEDDGAAFDPTAAAADFAGPDPHSGGGVGLELVRTWCDSAAYTRDGATNRLTLILDRTSQ